MIWIYNLGLMAGTAYLVQSKNWSPWWFLFAVLCLASHRSNS